MAKYLSNIVKGWPTVQGSPRLTLSLGPSQDPKDKRKILLDDKLKTIFTSPLTMFTMNTQLSKHCKTNGERWALRQAT